MSEFVNNNGFNFQDDDKWPAPLNIPARPARRGGDTKGLMTDPARN